MCKTILPRRLACSCSALHGCATLLRMVNARTFELVDKKCLAKSLHVSIRTVDSLMASRKVPFVRLTKRCVRFDLQKVQEALNRFEIRSVS